MEKPTKKQRKALLTVGITGAVYLSFKYLLPLGIPFLIAYLIAMALKPSVRWIERRFRIRIKGKEWTIPAGMIGGVELLVVLTLLGLGLYIGGKRLCLEARLLLKNLPEIIARLDTWLTGLCFWLEDVFHLKHGCLVSVLQDMIRSMGKTAKDGTMPFLMVNSMTALKWAVKAIVLTVILCVGSVLSLTEMESLKRRRERSAFCNEFALLGNRLLIVGNAWLKTQLCIMLLTMGICMGGLALQKNPYSILLGIAIGLLDALPIFGTGTVLIPWSLFCFSMGNWGRGVLLLAIYVICYFLRELLEAKIMSGRVGLSALETLISMYVGLQLFGILGFILGPIGLLIIRDLVNYYEGEAV